MHLTQKEREREKAWVKARKNILFCDLSLATALTGEITEGKQELPVLQV